MKIEDVKKVFCGEFRSVHDHDLFWNQFPIFLYFVDDPCVLLTFKLQYANNSSHLCLWLLEFEAYMPTF